nr:hypothetical protein [Tanacetum cinerariifolium]
SALARQQVICATTTIYPILGDESAVKGFIQWPIFAIGRYKGTSKPPVTEVPTKRLMPQHERAPSSKKGKVNDTPKNPTRRTKHLKIQPTNKNQYSGLKMRKMPTERGCKIWKMIY